MADEKDTDAPEKKTAPAKPKTKKFVVRAGCNIHTGNPVRKYRSGSVVDLTAAEAKHFAKLGMLDPFVEEDDEAGDA